MAVKRKFIDIEIPIIGTSYAVMQTEKMEGKTIKLDLTRKLKGKSLEAIFMIFNKEGLKAFPKKLALMKFYIRRMMRKRANYVEDSFQAECKDIKATFKPFLITRKKVSRAVRNNLRVTAREFILKEAKERNYLEICEEILTGEFQRKMLPSLKKVYPLSFCEIRVLETKDLKNANFTLPDKKVDIQEIPEEVQEIQEEVKPIEEKKAEEEAKVEEKDKTEKKKKEKKKKASKKE